MKSIDNFIRSATLSTALGLTALACGGKEECTPAPADAGANYDDGCSRELSCKYSCQEIKNDPTVCRGVQCNYLTSAQAAQAQRYAVVSYDCSNRCE